MSHNLCCCSPCRPTFKRHVDAIYPANPDDGLVKNKMETLIYYSLTSSEKLDRIGEYLEQRISRDIYRNRRGLVMIGMEAMDGLIKSCHVNTLNLFVESFLKTVLKLLESTDPDLQILASQSFSKFSQIKEDTPNYHRSYNFFIERFSQMCHSDYMDEELRRNLRLSGLHGLNGVIRKTVNEELAENIWDPKHMDKIVPSLLYNIDPTDFRGKAGRETPDLTSSIDEQRSPSRVADQVLRELVMAASFGSIKAILKPVLEFMRDHKLWDEAGLSHCIYSFEAIMYSIQTDLSYIVIDSLMSHLDVTINTIKQKASIAIVLSRIIGIGVGDSTVGPAVLEIINELLKHLKKSVDQEKNYDQSSSSPLQQLQHALLEALGCYAGKMPDFQKIEIMTFILSKVPVLDNQAGALDHEMQIVLMKGLFCVAETHTATLFSTTFSPQLLSTLLRLLQTPDQDVRLLVLQTFQILVDRHNNREKLLNPILDPGSLDLEGYPSKFSRSDQIFVQKSLFNVFAHFKRVLEEQGNSVEFIAAIYTTCALLHIETSSTDESVFYLLDLLDFVQNTAVKNMSLSTEIRFALHSVAFCLLTLMATTINSSDLFYYAETLTNIRKEKAPHMLPPLSEQYHPGLNANTPDETTLIDAETIKEFLKNAGKDVQRMDSLPRKKSPSRSSWPEASLNLTSSPSSRRESTISSSSIIQEYSSGASTPGIMRKPPSDEVSVVAFKKILEGPTQFDKDNEASRRRYWQDKFLNASLKELNKLTTKEGPTLNDFVKNFLIQLPLEEIQSPENQEDFVSSISEETYERLFPEIFTD